MAKHPIYTDWSDYDRKKKEDAVNFTCAEKWEVDYLKDKIKKTYPVLTENQIIKAIQDCCKYVVGSKPREDLVDCVLKRLYEI